MLKASQNVSGNSKLRSVFRALVPLFLVLGIGLATIVSLLIYTTDALDRTTRNDLKLRLEIALRVEAKILTELAVEYSYWEEAYENLIAEPNAGWAFSEIGSYLHERDGITLAIAVAPDDTPTLVFENGVQASIDLPMLLQNGLEYSLSQDKAADLPDQAASVILRLNGDIYLLAVNMITADYEMETSDGSYLVLARKIDDAYLHFIAETYEINSLRFASETQIPNDITLTLKDYRGRSLTLLTWRDPAALKHSGDELVVIVLVIMLAMSLLTLGMVLAELSRRQRFSRLLIDHAYRDMLTGIANRRAFFEKGAAEISRANSTQNPVALLAIDVDNFKTINDEFGHAAGDEVLKELARLFINQSREFDLPARIGGEEFAILLPNKQLTEAHAMAERIREAVARMQDEGIVLCRPVTVSIGVSRHRLGETLADILNRADRALYVAKNSGRNRSVMEGDYSSSGNVEKLPRPVARK